MLNCVPMTRGGKKTSASQRAKMGGADITLHIIKMGGADIMDRHLLHITKMGGADITLHITKMGGADITLHITKMGGADITLHITKMGGADIMDRHLLHIIKMGGTDITDKHLLHIIARETPLMCYRPCAGQSTLPSTCSALSLAATHRDTVCAIYPVHIIIHDDEGQGLTKHTYLLT